MSNDSKAIVTDGLFTVAASFAVHSSQFQHVVWRVSLL